MPDLSKWTKVVTHPLGFAGFGLACISGALATWGPDKYPWLPYLFITLAGAVVDREKDTKPEARDFFTIDAVCLRHGEDG